jgi:hypothetical protein
VNAAGASVGMMAAIDLALALVEDNHGRNLAVLSPSHVCQLWKIAGCESNLLDHAAARKLAGIC